MDSQDDGRQRRRGMLDDGDYSANDTSGVGANNVIVVVVVVAVGVGGNVISRSRQWPFRHPHAPSRSSRPDPMQSDMLTSYAVVR